MGGLEEEGDGDPSGVQGGTCDLPFCVVVVAESCWW